MVERLGLESTCGSMDGRGLWIQVFDTFSPPSDGPALRVASRLTGFGERVVWLLLVGDVRYKGRQVAQIPFVKRVCASDFPILPTFLRRMSF